MEYNGILRNTTSSLVPTSRTYLIRSMQFEFHNTWQTYWLMKLVKISRNFQKKKMEEDHLIYRYTPVHSAVRYKSCSLRNFEQVYMF